MATQANPFDQFDTEAAVPKTGPVYGAPPKPDKPDQPKTTYRTLTDEEAQARGLDTAQKYQISSEGKVDPLPGTNKPTVEQGKASGFLLRALQANQAYEAQGVGARSYVGQTMQNNAPSTLNILPESIGNSPRRQVADTNQDDFIAASLRYESGAAIPPAELEAQRRRYFPMPGDGPDALAAKARLRATAIAALRESAGPSANSADEAFHAMKPVDQAPEAKGIGESIFGSSGSSPPEGEVQIGSGKNADGSAYPMYGRPEDQSLDANGLKKVSGNDPGYMQVASGVGDMVQGAGDAAGIALNPLAVTINGIAGEKVLPTDTGEAWRGALGLPHGTNQTIEMINRAAMGAFLPALGAGKLAGVLMPPGGGGGGVMARALGEFGARPMADLVSGAGAGAGGELAKAQGYGPAGQAVGMLAGGGAGSFASGFRSSVRDMAESSPSKVMQAADKHGITMLPADVGGVWTRMATGAVGRTLGGIPLAEGAEKAVGSAAAARDAVAGAIGRVADDTGAGQAAQKGATAFIDTSEKRGGELFERVSVPTESKVVLTNTRATLADAIKGFDSNPELSKIWVGNERLRKTLDALTPADVSGEGAAELTAATKRLQAAKSNYDNLINGVSDPAQVAAARQEMTAADQAVTAAASKANAMPEGGELSWGDMKRLRSIVGHIVGRPSLGSEGPEIASLKRLYGALTEDMKATAEKAGPRALTEFNRANQYWRGRETRISDVLSGILGPNMNKGEASAFEQINRWAQAKGGDFQRLSQAMRSLPQDEAETVRASIIARMGKAPKGQQNPDGTQFSPATFVTEWNGLSNRAKSVLFPDPDHRRALNEIVTVFDRMKRAGQFQNFSNTALGANATGVGLTALSGPTGIMMAAAYSAGTFGLGKMLASPKFARWLARSGQVQPKAALSYVGKLSDMFPSGSVAAQDARGLQTQLEQALAQSPVRAAAAPVGQNEQNRRGVPPEQ